MTKLSARRTDVSGQYTVTSPEGQVYRIHRDPPGRHGNQIIPGGFWVVGPDGVNLRGASTKRRALEILEGYFEGLPLDRC